MPEKYWHVYNYVARQWYETEMGKVEWQDRWYWNAMLFLEDYGQGLLNEKGEKEQECAFCMQPATEHTPTCWDHRSTVTNSNFWTETEEEQWGNQ